MSNAVNMYAILGPIVLGLVAIEFVYCLWKRNGYYSFQDSLIGVGTMMLAQCVNVAIAVAIMTAYGWIHRHFAIFEIPANFWTFAGCYIGVDLLFYWFHRAGHRINILWAAHATHHSTEELNYAVALRTSFSQRAASFLFYWPLAVIGFKPEVIIPIVAINLIIQFIPHTRVVPRLPKWIDFWLNTPYHHRVHHGANPIYWDKNYSGSFIIWDRLFGTYQDEVEPIFYGITIHPRSWDPTWLNMHWFAVLWNDARQATHFVDKLLVWIKPPGWRPRNLPPFGKAPAKSAANQIKYVTQPLGRSTGYLLFQLVAQLLVMFQIIANSAPFTNWEKFGLTLVLWWGITMWAAILESKPWARALEALRLAALALALGGLFLKYDMGSARIEALLATTALSLGWLFLWVRPATQAAIMANQAAKIAPDYHADWAADDSVSARELARRGELATAKPLGATV